MDRNKNYKFAVGEVIYNLPCSTRPDLVEGDCRITAVTEYGGRADVFRTNWFGKTYVNVAIRWSDKFNFWYWDAKS